MKTMAFIAPIVAGKEAAAREMFTLLKGDYKADAEALRERAGIAREQVWVQTTPMGDVCIIVWDTADYATSFKTFATDTSDHASWFRTQLTDIHGIDFADGANAPAPQIAAEWTDGSWTFGEGESKALAYPLKPGMLDEFRAWATELTGARLPDFARTRKEFGLTRQLFYTLSGPTGDYVVMYGDGSSDWMTRGMSATTNSNDAFLTWFRTNVQQFAAVPMFQPDATPPKVEKALDLTLRVPSQV